MPQQSPSTRTNTSFQCFKENNNYNYYKSMPLRPYKPQDSLALATIKATCDLTDPLALYCRHLDANKLQHHQTHQTHHTHHDQNTTTEKQWKAYIKSLQKSLELEILFPGTVCWVVVQSIHADENGGQEEETIIGFAIWNRHGHSSLARKWRVDGQRFSTRIKAIIAYTTMAITYPFDRSINHTNTTKFHQRIRSPPPSLLLPNQKFLLPRERWELEALYISPLYQRQGYGMEALSWGIGVARQEKVEIWVWSSDAGKRVYENAGFEVLGCIGFGDLLASISNDGNGDEVTVWVMVWRDKE